MLNQGNKKPTISESKACKIFFKALQVKSQTTINRFIKDSPNVFCSIGISRAKVLWFYAALYCGTLSIDSLFTLKQSDRIKEMLNKKLFVSEDFYNVIKELDQTYARWSRPGRPFEGIAKYLYLKLGFAAREARPETKIADKSDLAMVYIIEATLIEVSKTWEHINECFVIVDDNVIIKKHA